VLRGLWRYLTLTFKGHGIVRLTSVFFVVALAAATSFAGFVAAQEQTPEQAPTGKVQTFGPRNKPPQPAAGQVPPAEKIAKHGSWEVQCAQPPKDETGAQPAGRACGMLQSAQSEKNAKIGLSVIVSKIKNGEKSSVLMRVLAPIGVYLPTGIPIEIDGAALPNRLQFTRCSPRICEGFGEASPESLKKFMKGNDATFYIYDRPGNGYPIKLSLEGFAASLGELDKL
jgi:invasion protein IalB